MENLGLYQERLAFSALVRLTLWFRLNFLGEQIPPADLPRGHGLFGYFPS